MKNNEAIDSLDNYILTINIAAVAGFFFVFQADLSQNFEKILVLSSFSLFSLSLFLFIWYRFRYPKRMKLLEELREKTVHKFTDRIKTFTEDVFGPLARLKTRVELMEKLEKVKTPKGYEKFLAEVNNDIERLSTQANDKEKKKDAFTQSTDKALEYVIEGFLAHMTSNSKDDYDKAFNQPLEEKAPKIKLVIDKVSFKARRHVFAFGCVFIFFAIFIEILAQ